MTIELAEDDKTTPKAGPVPVDILRWFKKKKLKPAFSYREVWQAEHSLAFTVAKVMEIDILDRVKKSIEQAIEGGETLETWKKKIAPELEKSGWRSHVSDKALPSRLRLIYETNMRTARANGQADRIERTKAILPFMIYELGPSKVHRDEHAAWAKLTLPVDDPFWKEHFPPNGWNCFLPGTRIDGSIVGASKARYSGDAVEIETKSGALLSVTVNHPIATAHGWVSAGSLKVGDDCLSHRHGIDLPVLRTVDDKHCPSVVEDVFDALAMQGLHAFQPASLLDFHGEASRFVGEVEVVGSYVQLPQHDDTGANKGAIDGVFGGATVHPMLRLESPLGQKSILAGWFDTTSDSLPGRTHLLGDFGPRAPRPPDRHRVGVSTKRHAVGLEQWTERCATDGAFFGQRLKGGACAISPNEIGDVWNADFPAEHQQAAALQSGGETATTYAEFLGELLKWRAGEVAFDEIVSVRKFKFDGHVYDLESTTGWVLSSNIVASNCKCRVRQISRKAAEKEGIGEAPEEERVPYELPDGRKGTAPKGVDPSFAYPMGTKGRERALNDALKAAKKSKGQASMDHPTAIAVVVKHLAASGVKLEDLQASWPGERRAEHRTPRTYLAEETVAIAHGLSDGARRKLAELCNLCPSVYDTTGLTKFDGDAKTTRKYLDGELASAGLVGKRQSQNRLGLFPTDLARAVHALLNPQSTPT